MAVDLNLPVGYRFCPTDEELLGYYLRRKDLGHPLPAGLIIDYDVFGCNPWNLPGDPLEKRYFFMWVSRSNDALVGRRDTADGHWSFNGIVKPVMSSDGNSFLGTKRMLVFHYRAAATHAVQWRMHELRLPAGRTKMKSGYWAVYCVYSRRKTARDAVPVICADCMAEFQVLRESPPPPPPSPSSSDDDNDEFVIL